MARMNWLAALLLCFALSLEAQQSSPLPPADSGSPQQTAPVKLIPRSHDEREARFRARHRAILNVQVADATGKPVTGLTQEDFTLLVDQQPMPVTSLRPVIGGTSLVKGQVILLLDAVNSTPAELAYERSEITRYLAGGQSPLAYPTSIAVLSDSGAMVGDPSQERNMLAAELANLTAEMQSTNCSEKKSLQGQETEEAVSGSGIMPAGEIHPRKNHQVECLNQHFQRSVTALNGLAFDRRDVPGRIILVWLGPGWPTLSGPQFKPDTPDVKRNFFGYLVQLLTLLREAQVTVDAVSASDFLHMDEAPGTPDIALTDGVATEEQVSAGSLALQDLAHQSGGQVLNGSKDLAGAIGKCVADADAYYAMSFDFPPAASAGEFHTLHLQVNKPELTVRTSTGYYAEP